MDEPVVISSLVVSVISDSSKSVAENINSIEGAEVIKYNDYKIVVLVERPSIDASVEVSNQISKLNNVLDVSLAYCNIEELVFPDDVENQEMDEAK